MEFKWIEKMLVKKTLDIDEADGTFVEYQGTDASMHSEGRIYVKNGKAFIKWEDGTEDSEIYPNDELGVLNNCELL